MPANYIIDKVHKLIFVSWEGEATNQDFLEALTEYQTEVRGNPEYDDYSELLDFCGVNGTKLTSTGLLRIAQTASKSDKKDHPTKMAIVVNSLISQGFAKIYETYRHFTPRNRKKVRIFRSKDTALEWAKS